jgi:Fe-S-cluster containining protein
VASILSLPVVNLEQATFECTFGRGCEGLCCKNGRPGLRDEEIEIITNNLKKFLPLLRPEARKVVEESGFLTRRYRSGLPMIGVVKEWCLFFNEGCVFHKVGAEEGDAYKYKPIQCALFPLLPEDDGTWIVRQHGYRGEPWDIFCLAPDNSRVPASESLKDEMALAIRWLNAQERKRTRKPKRKPITSKVRATKKSQRAR